MADQEAAARLRQARADKGIPSARDAARQFGWNENTYKAHEGGGRGFDLETAERYGKKLGASGLWLRYGLDPAAALSEQEREVLRRFRALSEDDQRRFLRVISVLLTWTDIDGVEERAAEIAKTYAENLERVRAGGEPLPLKKRA